MWEIKKTINIKGRKDQPQTKDDRKFGLTAVVTLEGISRIGFPDGIVLIYTQIVNKILSETRGASD